MCFPARKVIICLFGCSEDAHYLRCVVYVVMASSVNSLLEIT